MNTNSTEFLFLGLLALVVVSGFFSGSETGMMAVNRYRLQHLASKNRTAKRLVDMLSRPDRLLGVILIGNTFANILASAIATMIAVRWFGEAGVVVSTVLLTLVVLIFVEVMPKTVAALFSERVAFIASLPLKGLLTIFYPLVWLVNGVANTFLRVLGVKVKQYRLEPLSRAELRSLVLTAGDKISTAYQEMLLGILDLEKVTVDDIMVPHHRATGININDSWPAIMQQLEQSQYIRLPVYEDTLDHLKGFIHARKLLNLVTADKLDKKSLLRSLEVVHYVPEGTLLSKQLSNFRQHKYRIGVVVDEYGGIKGLVTLSDILEEIIGEFCTDLADDKEIHSRSDGSYVVDGDIATRDLNRLTGWHLPVEGPNTLSGLIVEYLETIPHTPVAMRIGDYIIEVLRVNNNKIVKVKVGPCLSKKNH